MIESLTYKKIDKPTMVAWADSVAYLQRCPTTTFKPGLNILYGPNGSGKSTLLKMLANGLAAEQGGTSTVTQSWVGDLFGLIEDDIKVNFDIVHDGQPVMFFDARAKEGLMRGGFDDDFFNLGVANLMARGSAGQLVAGRMDRMLRVLTGEAELEKARLAQEQAEVIKKATSKQAKRTGRSASSFQRSARPPRPLVESGFPQQIQWRITKDSVNSFWQRRLEQAERLLAARIPAGPKTLLFDEPESGFSLPWQSGLWQNVFAQIDPQEFQVIIATHSPFALRIPGANYIEMEPGYMTQSEVAVATLMSRFAAK